MDDFVEGLEFGDVAETRFADLVISHVGKITPTEELYNKTRHLIPYNDFDAREGDFRITTKNFDVLRIDVKRVESDERHWVEGRRKSFTVNDKSVLTFQGDLYAGCNNAMTEFFMVQKEFVALYGNHQFGPFYAVNVLDRRFGAVKLETWLATGLPVSWPVK